MVELNSKEILWASGRSPISWPWAYVCSDQLHFQSERMPMQEDFVGVLLPDSLGNLASCSLHYCLPVANAITPWPGQTVTMLKEQNVAKNTKGGIVVTGASKILAPQNNFPQKGDHLPLNSEYFPISHFDPPKYIELRAFY